MAKVFQVGDVVYHPLYGSGEVNKIYVNESDPSPYAVHFKDETGVRWIAECMLSFTPWPAPVHERPLQDGLYMVTYSSEYLFIAVRKEGRWYWCNGGSRDWYDNKVGDQGRVKVVKFLTELPNK